MTDHVKAGPFGVGEVVLLAAGKGTRMKELTATIPKTLIPILENRCILEINISAIAQSGAATRIQVIGGHAWMSLLAHLGSYAGSEIPVDGILNPQYAVAGPCRSIQLALANAKSHERIMIANGDTIFTAAAFERMKLQDEGFYLLGSHVPDVQADDLIIDCNEEGLIREATKAKSDGGPAIISTGMFAAVGVAAVNMLSDAVTDVLKREEATGRQLPWHDIVGYVSANGRPARLALVDRATWYEFDSRSCIERFKSEHEISFLRA